MRINQLNELIGSVIPEITLKVDNVYPPKTGTGKKGPWHCQNLACSDETGKLRVSVWNHSELENDIKGTQIKLKSIAGKRGLSGVVCELNEWEKNGEQHKDLQLKVNDNGIIITQTGSVGSKSLDTGYDKKTTISQEAQEGIKALAEHIRPICTTPLTVKPTITDPDAKVEQYTQLYQLCLDWSDTIKHVGFNNEDYRQIASCFFIQGIKDGLHLQMTVKPDPENDDIPY